MNKFAIVITTHKRKDESTKEKIKKALESLNNQTYKNWHLFLIGDRYEDEEEFQEITSFIKEEKITAINLPYAAERDSGKFTGQSLW